MLSGIISTSILLDVAPAMLAHPGARPKPDKEASMFGILTHKISGVYEIVNTVNGHRYIGSAVDVCRRWKRHKADLRQGVHHSQYLQRAWDKYGESCFQFSVIEKCDGSVLIEREQFHISSIHPEYNVSPTASSSWGKGVIPWNKGKKRKTEAEE